MLNCAPCDKVPDALMVLAGLLRRHRELVVTTSTSVVPLASMRVLELGVTEVEDPGTSGTGVDVGLSGPWKKVVGGRQHDGGSVGGQHI